MEITYTEDTVIKCIWKDIEPEEVITYSFSKGGDGSWTKGSSEDFEMTVNRSKDDDTTFSLFSGIEVDGTAVDSSNFTASSGSLNAALKASYLETLSDGSHAIKVNFQDGSAETTLTINAVPEESSAVNEQPADTSTPAVTADTPKTGDTSRIKLYAGLLLASLIILGSVFFLMRRKNKMNESEEDSGEETTGKVFKADRSGEDEDGKGSDS